MLARLAHVGVASSLGALLFDGNTRGLLADAKFVWSVSKEALAAVAAVAGGSKVFAGPRFVARSSFPFSQLRFAVREDTLVAILADAPVPPRADSRLEDVRVSGQPRWRSFAHRQLKHRWNRWENY